MNDGSSEWLERDVQGDRQAIVLDKALVPKEMLAGDMRATPI